MKERKNFQKIVRKIKVLNKIIKLQLSTDLTYRTQLFSWILGDSINLITIAFVWSNVLKDQETYLLSYYFLGLLVVKFTKDWSYIYISDSIARGDYSNVLLKPLRPIINYLGINIGAQLLRTIFVFPLLITIYIFLSKDLYYQIDFLNISIFIIFIILGFLINYTLGNIFALIAIWVKQMHGLRILYSNLLDVASGLIIPYVLLPEQANNILNLLPFKYIFHTPVNILVRGNTNNTTQDILLGVVWLAVLYLTYIFVFNKSIKKHNAEGI